MSLALQMTLQILEEIPDEKLDELLGIINNEKSRRFYEKHPEAKEKKNKKNAENKKLQEQMREWEKDDRKRPPPGTGQYGYS